MSFAKQSGHNGSRINGTPVRKSISNINYARSPSMDYNNNNDSSSDTKLHTRQLSVAKQKDLVNRLYSSNKPTDDSNNNNINNKLSISRSTTITAKSRSRGKSLSNSVNNTPMKSYSSNLISSTPIIPTQHSKSPSVSRIPVLSPTIDTHRSTALHSTRSSSTAYESLSPLNHKSSYIPRLVSTPANSNEGMAVLHDRTNTTPPRYTPSRSNNRSNDKIDINSSIPQSIDNNIIDENDGANDRSVVELDKYDVDVNMSDDDKNESTATPTYPTTSSSKQPIALYQQSIDDSYSTDNNINLMHESNDILDNSTTSDALISDVNTPATTDIPIESIDESTPSHQSNRSIPFDNAISMVNTAVNDTTVSTNDVTDNIVSIQDIDTGVVESVSTLDPINDVFSIKPDDSDMVTATVAAVQSSETTAHTDDDVPHTKLSDHTVEGGTTDHNKSSIHSMPNDISRSHSSVDLGFDDDDQSFDLNSPSPIISEPITISTDTQQNTIVSHHPSTNLLFSPTSMDLLSDEDNHVLQQHMNGLDSTITSPIASMYNTNDITQYTVPTNHQPQPIQHVDTATQHSRNIFSESTNPLSSTSIYASPSNSIDEPVLTTTHTTDSNNTVQRKDSVDIGFDSLESPLNDDDLPDTHHHNTSNHTTAIDQSILVPSVIHQLNQHSKPIDSTDDCIQLLPTIRSTDHQSPNDSTADHSTVPPQSQSRRSSIDALRASVKDITNIATPIIPIQTYNDHLHTLLNGVTMIKLPRQGNKIKDVLVKLIERADSKYIIQWSSATKKNINDTQLCVNECHLVLGQSDGLFAKKYQSTHSHADTRSFSILHSSRSLDIIVPDQIIYDEIMCVLRVLPFISVRGV